MLIRPLILLAASLLLLENTAFAGFPGEEKIIGRELRLAANQDFASKSTTKQNVIITLADKRGDTDAPRPENTKAMHLQIRDRIQQVKAMVDTPQLHMGVQLENSPVFAAGVTSEGLRALAGSPQVESIEPDRELTTYTQQGLDLMRLGSYGPFRTSEGGKGVAVAVIDTGVNYDHPALGTGFPNARIIGGIDLGEEDGDPRDNIGHGTACIGIISGSSGRGDYIGGVAPGAKIYAIKVSTSSMRIVQSYLLKALDWCESHKNDDPKAPIKVVSISIGGNAVHSKNCAPDSPSTQKALEKLTRSGITVFAASGNEGKAGSIAYPSCLQDAIAVGAVFDSNIPGYELCSEAKKEQVTCYSNSAPILGLLAPSDNVTVPGMKGGDYKTDFNGTSAATPYAAGVAALVQSRYYLKSGKYLAPSQLRALLKENGDPLVDAKSGVTTPRVNIERSLAAVDTMTGGQNPTPAPPPGGKPDGDPTDALRAALRGKIK